MAQHRHAAQKRSTLRKLGAAFALVAVAPQAAAQEDLRITLTAPCVPDPCAMNASAEFQQLMPAINLVINRMAAQPLSGAPVVEALRNPANAFRTCAESSLPRPDGSAAFYNHGRRTLSVAPSPSLAAMAHEAYHGYQRLSGNNDWPWDAPQTAARENVFAQMVMEASAAAYVFVIHREMAESDPAVYTQFKQGGMHYGVAPFFEEAYDKAWADNAHRSLAVRRNAALEAGGQAVVRALLTGQSPFWKEFYANRLSVDYMNHVAANPFIQANMLSATGGLVAPADDAYIARRNAALLQLGYVSPRMNMVPREYVTRDLSPVIAPVFQSLEFPRVTQTPVHNPPERTSTCKPTGVIAPLSSFYQSTPLKPAAVRLAFKR